MNTLAKLAAELKAIAEAEDEPDRFALMVLARRLEAQAEMQEAGL